MPLDDNLLGEDWEKKDKCKDKDECCICINIFPSHEERNPCDKDRKEWDNKHEDECCVCINIFCDCKIKKNGPC